MVFNFMKEYPDKTKCYECGEEGHLSYKCEKNLLGEREPPPKKPRNRKKKAMKELTEVLLYVILIEIICDICKLFLTFD